VFFSCTRERRSGNERNGKGERDGKEKRGVREKLNDKDSVRRAYKGNKVGSKSFKINAVLTHEVFKYNGLAGEVVRETFL